jgi:hypothetical protein
MPSDNLEKFFKENIEAVQHTPPPGSTWDPEATWLKLQNTPAPARRRKINWLHYAAAVFVLALLTGLVGQWWQNAPENPSPVVATTPTNETLPVTKPTESAALNKTRSKTGNHNIKVIPAPSKPAVAARQQNKLAVPPLALPGTKIKYSEEKTEISVTDKEQPASLAENQVSSTLAENTEPPTIAPPLKITVVLGASSSAKMLAATAPENLPDKKRKNRWRMNVPAIETPDKNHFALTDSAYKPLRLQARIDL